MAHWLALENFIKEVRFPISFGLILSHYIPFRLTAIQIASCDVFEQVRAVDAMLRLCREHRYFRSLVNSDKRTRSLSTAVDKENGVDLRIYWFELRQTTCYATWLAGLQDERARTRILKQIEQAQAGCLGELGQSWRTRFEDAAMTGMNGKRSKSL